MLNLPYQMTRTTITLALSLLTLAGCAPLPETVSRDDVAKQEIVFPKPPDEPRFVFERMIMSNIDVVPDTEERRLKELLTGERRSGVGLAKPYAIAVHAGRLYLTDTADRSVTVFDIPGERFFKFSAIPGGTLSKPLGIDVDNAGNVYVADATRKGIFVFDRDGQFLRRLGDDKTFDRVSSVTVDPDGARVYAVDIGGISSENHRVRVLDGKTGALKFDIGKRGTAPGEFNLPRDLAIGKDGRLYVVDGGNFRIQVFDRDGKYLTSWGKVGKQLGDFARPKEIATDAEGNVYVVDAAFGNFQIFSPDGDLLLVVGDRGEFNVPAQYMLPSGIFVDEDGRVYMVDQWFRKIDVFRPAALKANQGKAVAASAAGKGDVQTRR